MKDADLRRAYHRLCRKKPGTLNDTEQAFRAFKAGVEYGYTIEADARAEDDIVTTENKPDASDSNPTWYTPYEY